MKISTSNLFYYHFILFSTRWDKYMNTTSLCASIQQWSFVVTTCQYLNLGFILPGNYPDYRGNYPYSPILVRYHQNNGNAVTLSAHWVTSCIRGNYPWPNDKIKMTMATRTTIDLSFGKETIPIDVQTTSIDDWPHRWWWSRRHRGCRIRLSAVVCLFVHTE